MVTSSPVIKTDTLTLSWDMVPAIDEVLKLEPWSDMSFTAPLRGVTANHDVKSYRTFHFQDGGMFSYGKHS